MKIKIFTIMFLLFFAADALAFTFERPTTRTRVTRPTIPDTTVEVEVPTIPRVRVSTNRESSTEIAKLKAAIKDLQTQIDGLGTTSYIEGIFANIVARLSVLKGQIDAINIPAVVTPIFNQLYSQIVNLQTQIDAIPPQLDPYSVIVPIFSGNCTISTPISLNPDPNHRAVFCLDRVEFNTAQNYLSVDPGGLITVLITGFYNFDIEIDGAEELVMNDVNQFPTYLDGIYPLWAGDVFYWQLIAFDNFDYQNIKINYVGAHKFPNPRILPHVPGPTQGPIIVPGPNDPEIVLPPEPRIEPHTPYQVP